MHMERLHKDWSYSFGRMSFEKLSEQTRLEFHQECTNTNNLGSPKIVDKNALENSTAMTIFCFRKSVVRLLVRFFL